MDEIILGKIQNVGTIESGRISSVGRITSGKIRSVGEMEFPAPPQFPLAALVDYYWPASALTVPLNDPVPDWTDVNAGKILDQTDPTRQPALIETLGSRAVKPDGSNDYLWTTDTDVMVNGAVASTGYAHLLVVSGAVNASGEQGGSASTANNNYVLTQSAIATTARAIYGTTGSGPAGITGAGGTYNTAIKQAILITCHNSQVKLWRNNVLLGTVSVSGNWSSNRFALGGRLRSSFVVPSPAAIHACGVAKGAIAIAYHTDPSALFAAATAEWGT